MFTWSDWFNNRDEKAKAELSGAIQSNPEVKKAALTVIEDLFPKKSKDIRIWVKKQN